MILEPNIAMASLYSFTFLIATVKDLVLYLYVFHCLPLANVHHKFVCFNAKKKKDVKFCFHIC